MQSSFSFWKLIKYFLWLGSIGFGGPMALVGYMKQDLMEKRNWISQSDFLNGLALASLCPGPIATQLAIYIGWFHARIWGATIVLLALTLPAFLMILIFAIIYTSYGDVVWKHAAFYGISAAVVAIIIRHAFLLSKMVVGNQYWLWVFFAISVVLSAFTSIAIYWIFLLNGILVCLIKAPPRFFSSFHTFLPIWMGMDSFSHYPMLLKLLFYFAWAGTVVFGSGFAIIPFIHEGVVQNYHWLSERQFLDAISIGMITPGPIILAVTFIGYLIAGLKGAIIATLGVFLPCYLCVILFAPHFNRIAHYEAVKAFVQGVTIAVAGTITGSTFLLSKNAIVDIPTVGILSCTLLALYFLKKIPEPAWLLMAAIIGIVVKGFH